MKYQVGDVVLLKQLVYKTRATDMVVRPEFPFPHYFEEKLIDTFGVIVIAEKHDTMVKSNLTTDDDNLYYWLSQINGKQYPFFENEVVGEVIR